MSLPGPSGRTSAVSQTVFLSDELVMAVADNAVHPPAVEANALAAHVCNIPSRRFVLNVN